MDYHQILELKKNERYSDIATYGSSTDPTSLDADTCFQIAVAFEKIGQYKKSVEWYLHAMKEIDAQEIYPEILRLYIEVRDFNNAEEILCEIEENGDIDINWFIGNYEILKGREASNKDKIEALEQLIEEEYVEQYMLELSALYILEGQNSAARRMCKKLQRIFEYGGKYFQQASILIEKIKSNDADSYAKQILSMFQRETNEKGMANSEKLFDIDIDTQNSDPIDQYEFPPAINDRFDHVVGLVEAKRKLLDFYTLLQYNQEMQTHEISSPEDENYHFIVRGAPGTGKSMIAGIIASLLVDFGIHNEEEVEVISKIDLEKNLSSGDYNQFLRMISGTGKQTIVIDNIDEVYGINDKGSSGIILEALAKAIEVGKSDYSFILIGGNTSIDRFLTSYSVLQGIFLFDITIPPYSMSQMIEIARILSKNKGYSLSSSACKALEVILKPQLKLPSFLWVKELIILLEKAILNVAKRISQLDYYTRDQLMIIEAEDFEEREEGESIEELLAQLDSLIGLASVKERVHKMVAMAQAFTEAQNHGIETKGGFGTLHMVFKGNAGTGKTTVARILGSIYKKLGILRNGDKTIECTRADLVGAYQGHTALNVKDKISEAMGGILFIDEAYSLCSSDGDSFGMEAINTLVAEIENNRDDLMVIIAGYSEDMEEFLRKNQGLASRFPNEVIFEDYTVEEMSDIFNSMVASRGMQMEMDCGKTILDYIRKESSRKNFGNARGVRNLVDRVVECQNVRLINIKSEGKAQKADDYVLIKQEDIFTAMAKTTTGKKSFEDWMNELNSLTGMNRVKRKVEQMVYRMQINKERIDRGQMDKASYGTLHMIFKGNAGTGKTTVARIIAGIYNTLGILPDGDVFIECGRADLVASYAGQTAPKVKQLIDKATGGVLFIDEAYSLCADDSDAFGKEAVDTLLAEMENKRNSLMVILAGYEKDMDMFLRRNQGLSSRIPNEIIFEDYTLEEMMQIFEILMSNNGFELKEDAKQLAYKLIEKKSKGSDFGNARGVRNVMDMVVEEQSVRLAKKMNAGEKLMDNDLKMILSEDIQAVLGTDESREKPINYWMEQLNALTGLAGVKEQVQKKVDTLLVQQKMDKLGLGNSKGFGTLHMVFKGNAGTGKTTVARIIAGIYNTLGILPDGNVFVECTRSDLVGQYQGQTAPKVKDVVQRAMGGILFIDEAYSLCKDAQDTFGREAIDTLIAEMENHRDKLMVIFAGYSDDMEVFFQQNQGLASRVPTEIIFEDYSPEEMRTIFEGMLQGQGLKLSEQAREKLLFLLDEKSRVENFGNARGVRNLVDKTVENRNSRLAEKIRSGVELEEEDYLLVTHKDIEGI